MRSLIRMTQRIVTGKLIGGIGKGGVTSRISLINLIPLNKKQKVNNEQNVNIQTHPLIWRRK
jgi:hypothetical protein